MIRTVRLSGIMIMPPGRTDVILTFWINIADFPRMTRTPSCLSLSVPRCFGGMTWMSRYEPLLEFSDPSGEMGPIESGGLAICHQDTRILISDGRWRDDMLCLLSFSSPGNSVNLPVVGGPDWRGLNHWRGIVWDPGIMGIPSLHLCYDCLCLIALFRDVPLFVRSQADLSALVLKDIGGWRTIVWELGSLGRVHPSCYAAFSFCLDEWQIKGLETVIGPAGLMTCYPCRVLVCAVLWWVSLPLWKPRSW